MVGSSNRGDKRRSEAGDDRDQSGDGNEDRQGPSLSPGGVVRFRRVGRAVWQPIITYPEQEPPLGDASRVTSYRSRLRAPTSAFARSSLGLKDEPLPADRHLDAK